jgi:hypothetical protein
MEGIKFNRIREKNNRTNTVLFLNAEGPQEFFKTSRINTLDSLNKNLQQYFLKKKNGILSKIHGNCNWHYQ